MNSSALVLPDLPETSPREPENIEHEFSFTEGSLEIIQAEPNSPPNNVGIGGSHMKAVEQSRKANIEGESSFQKTFDIIYVEEKLKDDDLNSTNKVTEYMEEKLPTNEEIANEQNDELMEKDKTNEPNFCIFECNILYLFFFLGSFLYLIADISFTHRRSGPLVFSKRAPLTLYHSALKNCLRTQQMLCFAPFSCCLSLL